jgi:hypothetical protein
MVAKLTEITKHATTNTQHNNQNKLPPYPPAALPSLSMGMASAPPDLSARGPQCLQKARVAGFVLAVFSSLVWGVQTRYIEQEREGWGLGLS